VTELILCSYSKHTPAEVVHVRRSLEGVGLLRCHAEAGLLLLLLGALAVDTCQLLDEQL
jgi:hypothetical protein